MAYRLSNQHLSRKQVIDFNKHIHALAHKQGTTALRAARDNYEYFAFRPTYQCPCCVSSTKDDKRVHGNTFVRHVTVDEGIVELRDEDVYDFQIDFPVFEPSRRKTDMTVSLLDIAMPAKRSGGQRYPTENLQTRLDPAYVEDFINSDSDIGDFIEIEDPDDFSFFDEEWEEVHNERQLERTQPKRSYSAVLRGNDC